MAIVDREGEFAVDLGDERRCAGSRSDSDRGTCSCTPPPRSTSVAADLDLATWRHVQAVNVESAPRLCQALTPAMAERGFGRVVFIASNTRVVAAGRGLPAVRGQQGGVVGIARSLASRSAQQGSRDCVAPGLTRTPFTEADLPSRRSRSLARARRSRAR